MNNKQLLFRTLSSAVFAAVTFFNTAEVSAQVKIGSNPTVINAANNLEVESADPTKKVSVDKTTGKVTIADGSQGAAKVLTSDANGVATWQPMKSTSINSFIQTSATGIVIPIAPGGGGSYCPLPVLGSVPPACAIDINKDGSFTISNAINDVVIDMIGQTTLALNNGTVQVFYLLYLDKTTPGTYELIDKFNLTMDAVSCSGYNLGFKTALKNLPPRSYNLKMYVIKWYKSATSTAN